MHQHSFDKTESVRLTVFKNISLIITLVALVVTYVNVFMSKNYVLGFIELALAFFVFIRITKREQIALNYGIAMLLFILTLQLCCLLSPQLT